MQLRKATRKKAKIRLGLSAVSGGGKTYSALLVAHGICNDWSKVAIIDSENNSAEKGQVRTQENSQGCDEALQAERIILHPVSHTLFKTAFSRSSRGDEAHF